MVTYHYTQSFNCCEGWSHGNTFTRAAVSVTGAVFHLEWMEFQWLSLRDVGDDNTLIRKACVCVWTREALINPASLSAELWGLAFVFLHCLATQTIVQQMSQPKWNTSLSLSATFPERCNKTWPPAVPRDFEWSTQKNCAEEIGTLHEIIDSYQF